MTRFINSFKFKNPSFFFLFIASFFTSLLRAESDFQVNVEKSRYVADVESILYSHHYFQHNPSPLYWRISPYYLPQLTDSSCSLASTTMLVNAARSYQHLKASQPLVTQDALLNEMNDESWRNAVKQGGDGIDLYQLKIYLEKSLKMYGVKNAHVIEIQTKSTSKENEHFLIQNLTESERTGKTFIIVNFNQKFFTGLESVGHFSPIGAYDSKTQRVLIMDTDREQYEPYWVPVKLLLKSMSTPDIPGGFYRGYIVVKIP